MKDVNDQISSNISAFEAAVFKKFCPNCGIPITEGTKRKKFCSDECRWSWWNAHPKPENWKKIERKLCPICGKEFKARIQYGRERRYCSRACANRGRKIKGEVQRI